MPDYSLKNKTNVFAQITANSAAPVTIPSLSDDPDIGEVMKYIKALAEQNLSYMQSSADWMGIAANQGQNGTGIRSLVNFNIEHPDPSNPLTLTRAAASWKPTVDTLPAIPTLPSLPDAFKVNLNQIQTDFKADLASLQTSWIADWLPASPTEVDALNSMLTKVLDGTYYTSSVAKLDALETELKNALTATTTSLKNAMDTSITDLKANLSSRLSTLDTKSATALALATDNTQNIAWARARDQAAAEAARAESEAATLWAARGFAIPPGALTYQALAGAQKTASLALVAAGDQAVRAQQLYFDVAQKNLDAWITATSLRVQTDLDSYKSQYAQRLAVAQLETEQNRAKVKQALDHIGLSLDFSKFAGDTAMRYRLGVNQAVAQLVSAYSQFFRDEIEYSVQTAAAQRAFYASLMDYYRAALQAAEFEMKGLFTDKELTAKYAQIAANFIVQSVGNHVQASSAAGNMYANVAGMAVNNMIGIVSKSASA